MSTILIRRPGEATYEMDEYALKRGGAGAYPAGTLMRDAGGRWVPLPPELGGALIVPLPEGDGGYCWRLDEDAGPGRGPVDAAGLVGELGGLGEEDLGRCEVWWEGAERTWPGREILVALEQRRMAAAREERLRRREAELEAGRSMVPTGDEPGAAAAGIGWMVVGGGVLAQLASLAGEGAVAGLLVGLGGTLVVAGALVLVGDMVARRVERALGRAARRMAED